ncbi:PEP-CTERM sorting domain-containing protein [Rhodopirellula halodulae]|uniref:PEP-CTERM sorting domain-containing protein n=1 Tax=Rhodopirellula halodulae TaxID=2894198 RepID=UPI001E2D3C28|nr:PEP-CTERM sorting domain-containing protein [Rhodopirellula sp. JC737]MCC9656477.1 hypothetical protein [Rhodopirellula sp. JC737]
MIDFDSVDSSSAPAPIESPPYFEDGFELDVSTDAFRSLLLGDDSYTGSTAFYANIPSATVTIANSSGFEFAFNSIDLARLNVNQLGGFSVQFRGFNGLTEVANQTVTIAAVGSVPSSNELETFAFNPDFDAVTSVSWVRTAGNAFQFDNVQVVAVPEPTSLAFCAFGAGVLGTRRARRRFFAPKN